MSVSSASQETSHPEFAIAMRGYDRAQVDDYIARLQEWMAESQQRAETAEQNLSHRERPTENNEAAARIAALVETALHEADSLTMRARAEADQELAVTREEAERLATAARAEADRLLSTARESAVVRVRVAQRSVAELEQASQADRDQVAASAAAAYRQTEQAVAERMRDTEAKATEILAQARRKAERIAAQAEQASAKRVRVHERRMKEAEAELAELGRRRDGVLEQLSQLRTAIESLVPGAASALAPELADDNDSG
jgi:DivIVA domain-containing protein